MFRWVGVAAPAQQYFQGLLELPCPAAQWVTGLDPGTWRLILPSAAGARALVHSGSGRSDGAVMACPPIQNRRLARRPVAVASDLGSVTHRVTARPRCRRVA